ncbi:hypothetical protein ABTD78_25955, partial [Acinetobacter baumannii]
MRALGWEVVGTSRSGREGTIAFDDAAAVTAAIGRATHILSSVPPDDAGDAVLAHYGAALRASGAWLGY